LQEWPSRKPTRLAHGIAGRGKAGGAEARPAHRAEPGPRRYYRCHRRQPLGVGGHAPGRCDAAPGLSCCGGSVDVTGSCEAGRGPLGFGTGATATLRDAGGEGLRPVPERRPGSCCSRERTAAPHARLKTSLSDVEELDDLSLAQLHINEHVAVQPRRHRRCRDLGRRRTRTVSVAHWTTGGDEGCDPASDDGIFEGWGKPLAPTRLGRACSDRVVDDDPSGVAEDRRRCRWRVPRGGLRPWCR
jgi:hypothetical protein